MDERKSSNANGEVVQCKKYILSDEDFSVTQESGHPVIHITFPQILSPGDVISVVFFIDMIDQFGSKAQIPFSYSFTYYDDNRAGDPYYKICYCPFFAEYYGGTSAVNVVFYDFYLEWDDEGLKLHCKYDDYHARYEVVSIRFVSILYL